MAVTTVPPSLTARVVALSDGANIATDAALGAVFTVTISGSRQLDNPTNLVEGVGYLWRITQGASGSHLLTYGGKFNWGASGEPTLSTSAGDVDYIGGVYNSDTDQVDMFDPSLGH